jgi:hypothetical protein
MPACRQPASGLSDFDGQSRLLAQVDSRLFGCGGAPSDDQDQVEVADACDCTGFVASLASGADDGEHLRVVT